jgi:glyoxylase-like metal-dependent hydrolase (beta-lactamase superfamily II)
MGNKFVFDTYGLLPQYHRIEQTILEAAPSHARMFGVDMVASPSAEKYLDEGDIVAFGNSSFEILFLPGHSPGSIAFYNEEQKIIFGGDVLFYLSIGRTDLPSGNHNQLVTSIKKNLFRLDDEFVVYSGHGQTTTLGNEKRFNPFLQ